MIQDDPQADSSATSADQSTFQLVSAHQGVTITCNVMQPVGDGVRDLTFLVRGPTPGDLSRWFDTFDGTIDDQSDWYRLDFGQPELITTIFFMHGPMFSDGGWWTELRAEYCAADGSWQTIPGYTLTPDYDFRDLRAERTPFEAYQISFPALETSQVRLIGQPGGAVRITTLSYLAAGRASPDMVDAYRASLPRPTPKIFRLLAPNTLWDFISALQAVTRINFDVQATEGLGLDHYLNGARYDQFHARIAAQNKSESLYNLLGSHEGWKPFSVDMLVARALAIQSQQLEMRQHHGGMVWIVLPVIMDGQVVGTIENRNLLCLDTPDSLWHTTTQERHRIDPAVYGTALAEVPRHTQAQLEEIMRLVALVIDLVRLGLPLQM